jgi:hypothetical protein
MRWLFHLSLFHEATDALEGIVLFERLSLANKSIELSTVLTFARLVRAGLVHLQRIPFAQATGAGISDGLVYLFRVPPRGA